MAWPHLEALLVGVKALQRLLVRLDGGALALNRAHHLPAPVRRHDVAQLLHARARLLPIEVLLLLAREALKARPQVVLEHLRTHRTTSASGSAPCGIRLCVHTSKRGRTSSIWARLPSFLESVLRAAEHFWSHIRVLAASSTMPRISGGFMLSTLVMRPCMMRKCGLLTLSETDWNRS